MVLATMVVSKVSKDICFTFLIKKNITNIKTNSKAMLSSKEQQAYAKMITGEVRLLKEQTRPYLFDLLTNMLPRSLSIGWCVLEVTPSS